MKHRRKTEEVELAFKKKQDFQVVKLPCGHGTIQINYGQDQVVGCSQCGRRALLITRNRIPKWEYLK